MKLIITFFLFSLFSSHILYSQHNINYSFLIENCNGEQDIIVLRGQMQEGEKIAFAEHEFAQANSTMQFFYDLLVGGELGFPAGSLNENIECLIKLCGICEINLSEVSPLNKLLNLLCLRIEVTGDKSGIHSESEYYLLKDGYESFFRIPLAKLVPFLNYASYSIDDFIPFFVNNNGEAEFSGIRKEVDDNFLNIYTKHFSTIGIGYKLDSPTSMTNKNLNPNEYYLNQNYPNPFNPSTSIKYSIKDKGFTTLKIYNILGEEVKSLVNEVQSAGVYTIEFNANDFTSGTYFYTLKSKNFTKTNKMSLVK